MWQMASSQRPALWHQWRCPQRRQGLVATQQQGAVQVVVTAHHQLRVDGALAERGKGVGADRTGRLLPLLEQCLGASCALPALVPSVWPASTSRSGVVSGLSGGSWRWGGVLMVESSLSVSA